MDHKKELYGQGEWGETETGRNQETSGTEYGAHVTYGQGAGLLLAGRPGAQHMTWGSTREHHGAEGHERRTSGQKVWREKRQEDTGEGRGNPQGSKQGGVGKKQGRGT